MSTESPVSPADLDVAGEALREIRQCSEDLRSFTTGLFDQLGRLADELLTHELTRQQVRQQSEREALQGQIDRLASVTNEIVEVLARQNERMASHQVGGVQETAPVPIALEMKPENNAM